uniref:Protein tyrosine phosphatase type IVA 3 n=1 Tax=Lynx canadensis TaxID=61383 RepID=A0A667IZ91_LYNCA
GAGLCYSALPPPRCLQSICAAGAGLQGGFCVSIKPRDLGLLGLCGGGGRWGLLHCGPQPRAAPPWAPRSSEEHGPDEPAGPRGGELQEDAFLITHNPTNATLSTFIEDLKKYGATTVVRVCEVTYDKAPLEKDGITVVDWPFDDGAPPPGKVVEDWLSLLKAKFCDDPGSCVAVHCVAGLGRAPVLVALASHRERNEVRRRHQFIRQKRRGAINSKQLTYLEKYRPKQRLRFKEHTHTRPSAVSCSPGPPSRAPRPLPPRLLSPAPRHPCVPWVQLALRPSAVSSRLVIPVSPSARVHHFADLPFPLSLCPASLRLGPGAPSLSASLGVSASPRV